MTHAERPQDMPAEDAARWPLGGGRRMAGLRWWMALALVCLIFLLANWLVIAGRAVPYMDADSAFMPYYVLVADHARAGHLVRWDPWSNGGSPALADPQIGAFSPLTCVFGLLTGGTTWGFRTYWLTMWGVGGIGMLLLSRHLRSPWWGAVAVSLGFLFCGLYTGQAEHTSHVVSFSFIPWILWRWDVALRRRSLLAAAQAGALWGLSALAGYPGLTMGTAAFCGMWVFVPICRRIGMRGRNASVWRRLRGLGFPVVIAVAVGGTVLAPSYFAFFYESAGYHVRVEGMPYKDAATNSLHPGAMSTLASPYLGLVPRLNPQLWPNNDVSSCSIYVGVLVTLLAMFSLHRRSLARQRWCILFLGLVFLAVALGSSTPLHGWLYRLLLPMRYLRHPSQFRDFLMMSLFVLASLGARDIAAIARLAPLKQRAYAKVAELLLLLGATMAVIGILRMHQIVPEPKARWAMLHLLLWTAAASLVFASFRFSLRRRWLLASGVVLLAGIDAAASQYLTRELIANSDRVFTERWAMLDRSHSAKLSLSELARRPLRAYAAQAGEPILNNDQLVDKVPTFSCYTTFLHPVHNLISGSMALLARVSSERRIWFSPSPAFCAPGPDSLSRFVKRSNELREWPMVIHSPQQMLETPGVELPAGGMETATAARAVDTELLSYEPNTLSLQVRTESPGWLLVTDRWARSWQVAVNGRPVPNYGANFIFRGVPVEAGISTVTFSYRPGMPWLAVVSWSVLLLTGAFSVGASWRQRRRGTEGV